jgi:hypothetical protein
MKLLDSFPFSTTVRVHPHAALAQIREAVRPKVLRSQRRWKRRATLRKWRLRAEWTLLVTIGVLGTFCAALFLANETYHFVSYIAERVQ